ncbi:MAG: hypothetical protein HC866_23280 [Leptolyngbyaceae cyanobacterium RU_5_1]|nr:hypothetical protein [Leptolyngbyaceae cyanobacterium RU_5_1]
MTSQQDQIQSLIAEIDSVLQKAANPRLPWASVSGETAQQRQVLERVRNYLIALRQRLATEGGFSSASTRSSLPTYDYTQPSEPELTADQMMQTILREMSYLRANLMQPLQADLEALHQRRERLMQEVQHLEAQRKDYALAQPPANQQQLTAELLQVLMSRLQENLSQRIVQTLNNVRNQSSPPDTSPPSPGGASPSTLSSAQYEQLQALRSRSDQMLVNLDSALSVIFESLQRNIQSYQESLSQGLERMYNLGQQSEVTFKALVDQLAQQLKQEASAYLVSSDPARDQAVQPRTDDAPSPTRSTPSPTRSPAPTASPTAFPSTAQPDFPESRADSPATPPPSLDAAIESWLRSASVMVDFTPPVTEEFELAALDLSDLQLGQIEADVPELSSDASADPFLSPTTESADTAPADEATPTWDTLETIAADFSTGDDTGDIGDTADTEDIDATLKLLEELSAKLDHPPESAFREDTGVQFEPFISGEPPSATVERRWGISEDCSDRAGRVLPELVW